MRASNPLTASITALLSAATLAAALTGPATAATAGLATDPAIELATMPLAVGALTITVTPTANLGSSSSGQSLSAQLGTVMVSDTRGGMGHTWTASVSSTDFTNGGQTISNANISYWSGSATATTGSASSRTPGQSTAADAVPLSAQQTAFTCRTITGLSSTTSWNPTLVVTIPSTAPSGTYTATITHSVA